MVRVSDENYGNIPTITAAGMREMVRSRRAFALAADYHHGCGVGSTLASQRILADLRLGKI